MSTILGTGQYNFAVLWETIRKGIDGNGPYYIVDYYFDDYSQSDAVANALRGLSSRNGGVTTAGATIRFVGHQFPLSPNLYCSNVDIEGVGTPTINAQGMPYFTGGFIAHTEYRPPDWAGQVDPNNENSIDPDTPILWATQELDFETEDLVQDKNQYVWSTSDALNGKLTGIPVVARVGITTMTITYHQLPYMPMGIIRTLQGKVNNATFLGVPEGRIRFVGARTSRDFNTDGSICQKVSVVFKERTIDWRKFLRRDKLQWDFIKDSSANYIYDSADLSPLTRL